MKSVSWVVTTIFFLQWDRLEWDETEEDGTEKKKIFKNRALQ